MEIKEGSSGANQNDASGESDIENRIQTKEEKAVAYETYRRTVSQLKQLKEQFEKVQTQLSEKQIHEDKEKGRLSEVVTALETQLKKEKESKNSVLKAVISSNLDSSVKLTAQKYGIRSEALDDVLKLGDWSSVDFDEQTLKPDQSQIEKALEELAKTKSYLFQKQAKPIFGVTTGSGNSAEPDLKKLNKEDLLKALASR